MLMLQMIYVKPYKNLKSQIFQDIFLLQNALKIKNKIKKNVYIYFFPKVFNATQTC